MQSRLVTSKTMRENKRISLAQREREIKRDSETDRQTDRERVSQLALEKTKTIKLLF